MDIDKRLRLSPGFLLSFVLILVPSFIWMIGYDFSGMSLQPIAFTIVMKVGAFGGMAMFAWSLILSGRYKIFDSLFRGLDKVYLAHRFFGTASIALLLLHPLGYTFLHLHYEGTSDLFYHFLGFKSIAFTLGRVSLYSLILVGLWSIYAKAKHETFIKIHRFLGLFFAIGAIHAFMSGSGSVLATNQFMYWYILILSVVAVATFLHYSILADFLHPHFSYKVSGLDGLPGDVWEIKLKPKYRVVNFKPGQFLYLSFDALPEHGYHPFTVASSYHSSELVFYIKELGDLTGYLERLRVGDRVKVKGPYGGFTFNGNRFDKQLWIAGGIGITPFLSKARSLQHARRIPTVELIYTARSEEYAFAYGELFEIEKRNPAFNCTLVDEAEFGRKSLKDIAQNLGGLDDYVIYMCGPPSMLEAYASEAQELGLEGQMYYEEFNF